MWSSLNETETRKSVSPELGGSCFTIYQEAYAQAPPTKSTSARRQGETLNQDPRGLAASYQRSA